MTLFKISRQSFFSRTFFFQKTIITILVLGMAGFVLQNSLYEIYLRSIPYTHFNYEKDKTLVRKYFDEAFYRRTYAQDLQEKNQEPIDHFMQRSGRTRGNDFDPNDWFNATLYKERLWPCQGNGFVDFLRQPTLQLKSDAQPVEVYAREKEFSRAWMAVEGFMRMNTYKVILVLNETFKNNVPIRFKPMIERGLIVKFSADATLSFYKSPFLKEPDLYGVTKLPVENNAPLDQMITRFKGFDGYEYLMHRLYNYASWKEKGLINPCMLNFAHYCWEPIEFSSFGHTVPEFKKNMQRIAQGFDLMLMNSDIETSNRRIVPGYLFSSVTQEEVPQKKNFEISFLLSLGGKGLDSFKTRGSFIYHFRKMIWDNEAKFSLPTKFYISRRDKDKFPVSLANRLIPPGSMKWLYGSQFSIVIENSRQDYYFSEKLLSCLIGLSVPIYIGCPNVANYFDVRGILIAKDPDDVIRITQTLTPETYEKMLPYLQENKRRAIALLSLEDHYISNFYDQYLK